MGIARADPRAFLAGGHRPRALAVVVFAGSADSCRDFGLDDPKEPAIAILSFVKPFLAAQWVAVLILTAGHVCLAASFVLVFLRVTWASPAVQRALLLLPRPLAKNSAPTTAARTATAPAASVP